MIAHANRKGHTLITQPVWDPRDDTQEMNSWLRQQKPPFADAVRELLNGSVAADAAWPHGRLSIEVVPGSQSFWSTLQVCLEDAEVLLDRPLHLLLENASSDKAFLWRIAGNARRRTLDDAKKRGALEPEQAGGLGEIKKRIQRILADLESADPSTHACAAMDALRLWVMFDRDAHPEDRRRPSDTSDDVLGLWECAAVGAWCVPHHRLGRRSIENYIPSAALWHWATKGSHAEQTRRRETVEGFVSQDFGAERRHCYDMEEGLLEFLPTRAERDRLWKAWHDGRTLTKRIRAAHILNPGPPFDTLSDELRARLAVGFGRDIAQLFDECCLDDAIFEAEFAGETEAKALRERLFTTLFGAI